MRIIHTTRLFKLLALLNAFLFLPNNAGAETGGYMLIGPLSTITLEIHGECKTLRNLTDDASIYIPTAAHDSWTGMDSRTHEDGSLILEVTPCE